MGIKIGHLLTATQAAEYLKISDRWLRTLSVRGVVKFTETPLGRLYLKKHLRDWERYEKASRGRPNGTSGAPAPLTLLGPRVTVDAMAIADDTPGVGGGDNVGWTPARFDKWTADGVTSGEDPLVVEAPLEYRVDGEPLATVMRTPGDDFDLAVGFLFGEGWISSHDDIGAVCAGNRAVGDSEIHLDDAFTNVVDLRPSDAARTRMSKREMSGRSRYGPVVSSCGVCGKATIEEILKTIPRPAAEWLNATRGLRVSPQVIFGLPNQLRSHQPLFQRTGALHAAGIFDLSGDPLAVFEDIGRHNAVDKVIGRLLREDLVPLSRQLLVVSGRSSFEIVQKALRAGVPFVFAVSGVSHLAVELATQGGITLCGFTRQPAFTVYSHRERIGG